ncbi:M56 family metallopeptidase [Lacihabitans soyangensis]|uniref:TonB family protein n=1 Tax=Lacihabitans soyangensis TaxID=869394 RepID=A0AAE3KS54_9BACT|nr:M56 family metallopeptidase [Lacihabitans soyangensis]MCP9762234.1 TonB family protein [Lacihabitans soyangensis]
MEKLIPFVQINLFLVVFYAIYWLFLRKETFHQVNRFYLIGSSVISVLLPFADLSSVKTWALAGQIQSLIYEYDLPELVVSQNTQHKLNWVLIISILYLTIVAFLFLKLAFGVARAYAIIQSPSFNESNAFSFFGVIKIDKKLPHFRTIRAHERVHTIQLHFLDLFFFELLTTVFWCNPVVYLYRATIKNLHEFLADEEASRTLPTVADYATLLLSKQFKIAPEHLFVQQFHKKSTLKIRIQMLLKGKSNNWAILKYGVVAPILFLAVLVSSVSCSDVTIDKPVTIDILESAKVVAPPPPPPPPIARLSSSENVGSKPIFTAVEQSPEFFGGQTEMYKYLGQNIQYPADAQRANVSGKVFVKFIVEDDGSIGNVEVMKGIGFGCDEEAIRVVKSMPRWKPGVQNGKNVRVYYNMPIVYRLD